MVLRLVIQLLTLRLLLLLLLYMMVMMMMMIVATEFTFHTLAVPSCFFRFVALLALLR